MTVAAGEREGRDAGYVLEAEPVDFICIRFEE